MESLILSLFNETRISEYLDNERAVKKPTRKEGQPDIPEVHEIGAMLPETYQIEKENKNLRTQLSFDEYCEAVKTLFSGYRRTGIC